MKRKTFLLVIGFFLYFCYSMSSFAYIYYIPHIHTGNDAWETELIMDNSTNVEQTATVYYYDEDGNMIQKTEYICNPYTEKDIFLRQIGAIAAKVYTSSSMLRVRLGYIAKEDLGGGTAEFSPSTKLYKTMIMNTSNYYDELTWSGFALWNATNKTVNVTLKAFSEEEQLASKNIIMRPFEKIVDFFDSFFEVDSFKDITSVTIEAVQEALTGVVISGKENEKLLFAPPRGFTRYMNHEEYIDAYVDSTNVVYTGGDQKYHAFITTPVDVSGKRNKASNHIYHVSWNTYGPSDSIVSYPVDYNMDIQYIAPSEDGNSIYLFGTNDSKFVVKKVNVNDIEQIEWESVLGDEGYTNPLVYDPMDVKIRGCESNGSVFVTYKDKGNSWKGVTIILDASNGAVTSDFPGFSSSVQYGDVISYTKDSQKMVMTSLAYYTDYLQCMIYDSSGHEADQIFGVTPIPDAQGRLHLVMATTVYNNRVYMVVGVQTSVESGWTRYHLYLVSISLDDSNFTNASVTDLRTFVPHASSCFMFVNSLFSSKSKSISYSLEIITSPSLAEDFSKTIFVQVDDDGVPLNYPSFIKPLPYRVKGIGFILFGYYVFATENEYYDLTSYRTKIICKALFMDQMLNY